MTLAPGGLHIMFMGPKAPFKEGECVAVTLTFETRRRWTCSGCDGRRRRADAAPEHSH